MSPERSKSSSKNTSFLEEILCFEKNSFISVFDFKLIKSMSCSLF